MSRRKFIWILLSLLIHLTKYSESNLEQSGALWALSGAVGWFILNDFVFVFALSLKSLCIKIKDLLCIGRDLTSKVLELAQFSRAIKVINA